MTGEIKTEWPSMPPTTWFLDEVTRDRVEYCSAENVLILLRASTRLLKAERDKLAKVRAERDAALTREMGMAELCAALNADRHALQARVAELEAAQQWRPMATAPVTSRDRVLLCVMGHGQACRVVIGMRYPSTAERGGHWRTPERHVLDYDCVGWIPLPEPPKEVA